MDDDKRIYCQNTLLTFGNMLDVEAMQKISQMTSAPSLVYGYLYTHKEGSTPGELAKECRCMPSRITAILNNFEKDGCIERFQKDGDHRRIYVRLTKVGEKCFESYSEKLLSVVELLVDKFGKEKIEGFLTAMKDAISFIKEAEARKC